MLGYLLTCSGEECQPVVTGLKLLMHMMRHGKRLRIVAVWQWFEFYFHFNMVHRCRCCAFEKDT